MHAPTPPAASSDTRLRINMSTIPSRENSSISINIGTARLNRVTFLTIRVVFSDLLKVFTGLFLLYNK